MTYKKIIRDLSIFRLSLAFIFKYCFVHNTSLPNLSAIVTIDLAAFFRKPQD